MTLVRFAICRTTWTEGTPPPPSPANPFLASLFGGACPVRRADGFCAAYSFRLLCECSAIVGPCRAHDGQQYGASMSRHVASASDRLCRV